MRTPVAGMYLALAADCRASARAIRTRSRVLAGLAVAYAVAVPVAGVTVLGAQLGMLAAYLAFASRECAAEARGLARRAGECAAEARGLARRAGEARAEAARRCPP